MFKFVSRVRKRCTECITVWRNGVLRNVCAAFPKHKQKSGQKKIK